MHEHDSVSKNKIKVSVYFKVKSIMNSCFIYITQYALNALTSSLNQSAVVDQWYCGYLKLLLVFKCLCCIWYFFIFLHLKPHKWQLDTPMTHSLMKLEATVESNSSCWLYVIKTDFISHLFDTARVMMLINHTLISHRWLVRCSN